MLITILSAFSVASAADNETLWNQAAEYYDKGDFVSAIENYTKIIQRGYSNPKLFYNLGNSYFMAGDIGESIWAYRRALKIDPRMNQAAVNLEYARSFNTDKIQMEKGGFILDLWNGFTALLGLNGFLIIFTISWWLLASSLAYILIRGKDRSWPYYLLILGLVIAIFAGAASARRIKLDRLSVWGVLISQTADIREGPGDDFKRIEVGHEGLEFRILETRENSYLIELGNGLKGWVTKDAVIEI